MPPAAFYHYTADRKGVHPQGHLDQYRGHVHADGFSGYKELFKGDAITEVAFLAHIRRKLFDYHKANPSAIAEDALKQITALYRIEKEIRGLSTRDEATGPVGEGRALVQGPAAPS